MGAEVVEVKAATEATTMVAIIQEMEELVEVVVREVGEVRDKVGRRMIRMQGEMYPVEMVAMVEKGVKEAMGEITMVEITAEMAALVDPAVMEAEVAREETTL